MIKIENTDVHGFEAAIRGMRNPMNSWDNSDSGYCEGRSARCDNCPIEPDEYAPCYNALSNEGLHRVPYYHPARYYLYYTASFEGCAYYGNKEDVGAEYFNLHKDGENVNAVFERQWRADGSETYEIYLER